MRYASVKTWAEYFKKNEGIKISVITLYKRLLETDKIFRKARNDINILVKLYSESDIRSACAGILNPNLPQADKSNFFVKDGKKYGTIKAWSRVLPISEPTVVRRLKKSNFSSIPGKMIQGRKCNFYSESDIRSACADILNPNLPQADKSNFFVKDGKKYGTIKAWSRVLPISEPTVVRRLKKSDITFIKGKDFNNHRANFYSESDIRSACADLLNPDLPQADKSNFFVKDGKKYGTISAWSRVLKISVPTIKASIREVRRQHIEAKEKMGHISKFYSESDIRTACADLIKKRNLHAA